MSSGPVLVLRSSRLKWALLWLASAAFSAGSCAMVASGERIGWFPLSFFALCLVAATANLLPGASSLTLTTDGFTIRNLYRRTFHRWSDVRLFAAGRVGPNSGVIMAFSPDYPGAERARSLARTLTGAEGALPDTYGLDAGRLAALMNDWKQGSFRLDPKTSTPGPLLPEGLYVVEVTDSGVTCTRPDRTVESVTWDDLESVEILNTDEGPYNPDVFWVLHGSSGGCVVPQGATGEKDFLARLQELPGFDNQAVITAMVAVDNRSTVCWRRAGAPAPPGP